MYQQAIALSVGLCVFAFGARPQETVSSVWNIDQLVQTALTKNRNFLSAKQRLREAQGLLTQASVGIADTVDISGFAGQPFGKSGEDSLSATYSHTFETFGKRPRRVEVARKELAIAQAEIDEVRRALVYEVKMRYADAVAEELKLALIDRLSEVNQDYLDLIEARVQQGDAAQLEASLLRVEVNRDRSRRALTEGRVASALMQLQVNLDLAPPGVLRVAASLAVPQVSEDLPALNVKALQNRPDLRLLEIGAQQAQARLELAKAESRPNVTLSGQYSHQDSSFDQFGSAPNGALAPIREHIDSVGVGFSIPLTTMSRNRGNIEAAASRQTGASLRHEYLRNAVPAQVEAAYRAWRSSQDAASIFEQEVIAQSERNLEVMRKAYSLGELRLIDLLNEQRRLLDTELNYIDTQADRFRAYAALEHAVGGSL